MKINPKRLCLLVLASLLVVGSLLFYAGTGAALGGGDGEEWVCTPAALTKERAGFCPTGMICRELCYYSDPTGYFRCFNW